MSNQQFDYTRVRHADRVLSQTLGGEVLLLDLKSEQYFGLDPVGTRIWELIGELGDVDRVFEALVAEYDAPPETLATDLRTLLTRLVSAGLVQPDPPG
jgi:hypothetical protein